MTETIGNDRVDAHEATGRARELMAETIGDDRMDDHEALERLPIEPGS